MSFEQPAMLLGLLGALVPILIHLLFRRKPRQLPFAAIAFVLASIERVERRFRIKRWLLLAARVLIIAGLAVAAARPTPPKGPAEAPVARGPMRVGIVLDLTASMSAKYGDTTAFERAVRAARRIVTGLGDEDRASLVVVDHTPRLVVDLTADRSALGRALDQLEPGVAFGELSDAVSLSRDSLRAEDPKAETRSARIVVLTDLAGHGIKAAVDLGLEGEERRAALEILDVLAGVEARERSNYGITRGEAARRGGALLAEAEVRWYSKESGETDSLPRELELTIGGKPRKSVTVELVPGSTVEKQLEVELTESGYLPIQLRLEPDHFPLDDVRHAIADVRSELRLLIVDGAPSGVPKEDEIFYLERALAAGEPLGQIDVVVADDLGRPDLSRYELVLLAGVPTLRAEDAARLSAYVEGGGRLLLTVAPNLDVDAYNAGLARVLPRRLRGLKIVDGSAGSSPPVKVARPGRPHPVTSVFDEASIDGLLSTRTRGYFMLEPAAEGEAEILLSFDDGQPMLVLGSAGKGQVLVLTTSVDRELSDLAIRPAFLPLVRRAVQFLAGELSAVDRPETFAHGPRAIRPFEGATQVEVERPDGVKRTLDAAPELTFTETSVLGLYRVRAGDAKLEPMPAEDFVVNVDPRESDLSAISVEEALSVLGGEKPGGDQPVFASSSAGRKDGPRYAELLLALALLAFLAEAALTAARRDRARAPITGSTPRRA